MLLLHTIPTGGVAAGVSSKDDILLVVLRMRDEATNYTTATSTYYTLPGPPRLHIIDHVSHIMSPSTVIRVRRPQHS